jgi:predicted ATPase
MNLAVENFGPVRSGEFELKPLTIFIGPNNSGKSYMALLMYALAQALAASPGDAFQFSRLFSRVLSSQGYQFKVLEQRFREHGSDRKTVTFDDLPEDMKEKLSKELRKYLSGRGEYLQEVLHDYFGYEAMEELVRSQQRRKPLCFRLGDNGAEFLSFRLSPHQQDGTVRWGKPDLRSLRVRLPSVGNDEILSDLTTSLIVGDYWWKTLEANGLPQRDAYYLPSARSGILQGWQVYASMALQVVRRRIGLEPIEMAPFTGVAGDFLKLLYERLFTFPERRDAQRFQPALDILEGRMFKGQVSMQRTRAERPVILYSSGDVELPLPRASSMVAELAPLDLWIKYILAPGDLLIIDEPEAHLHPENQRNIARVLVRLVRAGVRVICPTHSSFILHQVSNHILASQADAETRAKLGFTEDDLLTSDDVGVYLFDAQADGTRITGVPIEPEVGISEEEFVRVAEAIGDETYRLSLALPGEDDGR